MLASEPAILDFSACFDYEQIMPFSVVMFVALGFAPNGEPLDRYGALEDETELAPCLDMLDPPAAR